LLAVKVKEDGGWWRLESSKEEAGWFEGSEAEEVGRGSRNEEDKISTGEGGKDVGDDEVDAGLEWAGGTGDAVVEDDLGNEDDEDDEEEVNGESGDDASGDETEGSL